MKRTALPSIPANAAAGHAWLVGAQMLGGNAGLGYLLMAKMNAYETDNPFAVVLLLASVGCGFHFAVRALRRLLVPWHATSA